MGPDSLPPARCDFPTRERENGLFKEKPSTKAVFPFLRGKNRISQGVENRGSLISVPLAVRVVSTPPICIAVRLPFVLQYASHLYRNTFVKILVVVVTGMFPKECPKIQCVTPCVAKACAVRPVFGRVVGKLGAADLSGPVLRDTARLSQRYPPIARCGVFRVSTWPIGCDTPPPFSARFPL